MKPCKLKQPALNKSIMWLVSNYFNHSTAVNIRKIDVYIEKKPPEM